MRSRLLLAVALSCLPVMATVAADTPSFTLTIRNHQFDPTELQVPAGQKIELQIVNQDATPEEFESPALHREKVVTGGSQTKIFIGPLKAGSYEFFGDYHPTTARGHIIAK
jgi:plastocyanin